MKRNLPTFLAGMFTMLLLGTLTFSALAISGRMTIEVDPINIQVNGETFVPKDAKGNEVPVFSYQGTTYAPLRALAEAYGLEVGYDASLNMATVGAINELPNTPQVDNVSYNFDYSYEEFKGLWDITKEEEYIDAKEGKRLLGTMRFIAKDENEVRAYIETAQPSTMDSYLKDFAIESLDGLLGFGKRWECNFQYNETGSSWFVSIMPRTDQGKIISIDFDSRLN